METKAKTISDFESISLSDDELSLINEGGNIPANAMKRFIFLKFWIIINLFPIITYASSSDIISIGDISQDTIKVNKLKEIVVEADMQSKIGNMTVFRPDARQKNASQTGFDLLVHLGIPMLTVIPEQGKISTSSDQPVTVFINKIKATPDEIKMIEVGRVSKVEYIDFPSDPRYLGNQHVVNFVIPRQEYGGYTKLYGVENFIADNGSLQANSKLNHKRMTYDLMAYGSYQAPDHTGSALSQYFNLPQTDADGQSFRRYSDNLGSRLRNQDYQASFRALYETPTFTANNMATSGWDRTPDNFFHGATRYEGKDILPSEYFSKSTKRSFFFRYNGNYSFTLSTNDILNIELQYEHSRTRSHSSYNESGVADILNGASDKTNSGGAWLTYSHSFGGKGSLNIYGSGYYEHNNTSYSGSCTASDRSSLSHFKGGVSYTLRKGHFYGSAGAGWVVSTTWLNGIRNTSSFPYADFFLQYSPSQKHSASFTFHHTAWAPSSNSRSDNILQTSPFVWITGNPLLSSSRTYDLGLNYTWIPSNMFSLSSFANTCLNSNMTAYNYEPYRDGVLRTILQPAGHLTTSTLGVRGTVRLFDRKLQITGNFTLNHTDNGRPFNYSRLSPYIWGRAFFYAGKFTFGAFYANGKRGLDPSFTGTVSGVWIRNKDSYYLSAGWANAGWNILLTIRNFARWNWENSVSELNTDIYGYRSTDYSTASHATIQLSATYTFSYGKKTDRNNELFKSSGASSGILE